MDTGSRIRGLIRIGSHHSFHGACGRDCSFGLSQWTLIICGRQLTVTRFGGGNELGRIRLRAWILLVCFGRHILRLHEKGCVSEMTFLTVVGFLAAICLSILCIYFGYKWDADGVADKLYRERLIANPRSLFRGPHIPLDSPCPACGHRSCTLKYEPIIRKLKRTCNVCGCVVEQDPIAPDLFKK